MKDFCTFPTLVRASGLSLFLGMCGVVAAQPSFNVASGTTHTQDMNASLSRGFAVSQSVGQGLSVDLDVLWAQGFNDQGVDVQRATMSSVGVGVRYTPFSSKSHTIRPWAGAGVSWQTTTHHADAQAANGHTYHLWNDGLLYAYEQPIPMPDVDMPSPLVRDNVYETMLDRSSHLAVPLRAGIDVQLTRRVHTTLAVTAIPGGDRTWTTVQAGIGFQLGRGKTYLKTLLPEEFLALGDDADGDGVKDTKDLCGGTEPGAWVDKNGCAIDTDADGVPDYRDAEIHSPDLLVNTDGISISLEEWNAMFVPEKGDPTTFAQDSATIISEWTADHFAQMLTQTGNTAAQTEKELLRDLREKVYNPAITYRVQYGAFSASGAPSTDMYTHSRVETLDNDRGLTLHVSPPFEHVADALCALTVARSAEHTDAFLTAYRNGVRITLEEAKFIEATCHRPEAEGNVAIQRQNVQFHVQLGRYTAGVPVAVLNAFLQMDKVEQRIEADGSLRYLTAGVDSEEMARHHLSSAMSLGFSDAFLVAEIDGVAVGIAEARNTLRKQTHNLASAQ